jgi:hypothetical protein
MSALGSLPPLAAFAHRKSESQPPSVRFLQVAQFSLQVQRRSAIRPSCRNVHGAASVTIGPLRTLMRGAANGGFEPNLRFFCSAANVYFSQTVVVSSA